MTTNLTRRATIAGAAALPILPGGATAEIPQSATDPAVLAYREWHAAVSHFHARLAKGWKDSDPEIEAADAADHAAAMKLASTVPTSLEGLAVLIAFLPYVYGELDREGDVTDPDNYTFASWLKDDREVALAHSLREGVARLLAERAS